MLSRVCRHLRPACGRFIARRRLQLAGRVYERRMQSGDGRTKLGELLASLVCMRSAAADGHKTTLFSNSSCCKTLHHIESVDSKFKIIFIMESQRPQQAIAAAARCCQAASCCSSAISSCWPRSAASHWRSASEAAALSCSPRLAIL